MVRKGLSRLDGVVSVSEEPSNASRTCKVQTRRGALLWPSEVAEQLRSIQIGARLRGMEAVIDGVVGREGKRLVLRMPGQPEVITLAKIKENVGWDEQSNAPLEILDHESRAYLELARRVGPGGIS